MDTENIEMLLSRLIEVNENISDQISDLKAELSEIRSELNWAEDLTFAKQVNDSLSSIELHLSGIEINVSSLG